MYKSNDDKKNEKNNNYNQTAINLLTKRKKLARFTFLDESLRRTLVLFKQHQKKTNEKSPTRNLGEESILNFKLHVPVDDKSEQIVNVSCELVDNNYDNYESFENNIKIATKQIKLEEKYRIRALEDEQIREAEKKGMIKVLPAAAAYFKLIEEKARQKSMRESRIKALEDGSKLKSFDPLDSSRLRSIEEIERSKFFEEKSVQDAKQRAINEFFQTQQTEETKRILSAEMRRKAEQARKKQKEESLKLKQLIEAEKKVEEEKQKQKAIEDAKRQRLLEEKIKQREAREASLKQKHEAKLKEERIALMKEFEAIRIRKEEMFKMREAEANRLKNNPCIKAKSVDCLTKTQVKLIPKPFSSNTKASVERRVSARIQTKLEVAIDKNLFREELRAVRELERKELEEKARRVAEDKAKRDAQMNTKLCSYNIDYLKDRIEIQKKRLVDETERIKTQENEEFQLREQARFKADCEAQKQAELESARCVSQQAKQRDLDEAKHNQILEEKRSEKLKQDKIKLTYSHTFLFKDLDTNAKLKAIQELENKMKTKPDPILDSFKQKAIEAVKLEINQLEKGKIKKKSASLRDYRPKTSMIISQQQQDTAKINAAFNYLASIEEFWQEKKIKNNPVSVVKKNKYGFDYLLERRQLNEKNLSKDKVKVTEKLEARKRAEERARKRLEIAVRKQVELGNDIDEYLSKVNMEDFFDNF